MFKSLIKTITGDIGEKREYRQTMNRFKALPEDYRFAFRKIHRYINSGAAAGGGVFTDLSVYKNLADLFEEAAANGQNALDVLGKDSAKFTDDLILASVPEKEAKQRKINAEIKNKLNKGGKNNA